MGKRQQIMHNQPRENNANTKLEELNQEQPFRYTYYQKLKVEVGANRVWTIQL